MSPNWFVGFPVEPGDWYQKVITNVPTGIKCFHPADLHITFAFLGAAGEEKSENAFQFIVKAGLRALSVTLGPMAAFGNPEKPSAYAFTLDSGRNEVIAIMQEYRDRLLEIAEKGPDRYAPRPHLTVARPPRSASDALRAMGLEWAIAVPPPAEVFSLDKIALYTWSENRAERQFKIVKSVSLSNEKSI